MKNLQLISLTLAMIFCLGSCDDHFGLNTLVTPSNADANSCLLTLTYTVKANRVVFDVQQYIPDPINRSCTFQDIVSAPLFYNVPFTAVNLNLTASATDENHLIGTWQISDLKAALGSSCMELGVYNNQLVYTCRFRYSGMFLYMNFWMSAADNTKLDTTATGILMTEMSTTSNSTTMYNISGIWTPNVNDKHLIGRIEDGCGLDNWDNIINDLNTHLTITGTTYLGTDAASTFDIQNVLGGATIFNVIALKNGANPKTYKSHQMTCCYGGLVPFNDLGTDKCTDATVKYGDFLPNMNYCADGCAVSLMTQTGAQAFVIQTNGIHTAASSLRA